MPDAPRLAEAVEFADNPEPSRPRMRFPRWILVACGLTVTPSHLRFSAERPGETRRLQRRSVIPCGRRRANGILGFVGAGRQP